MQRGAPSPMPAGRLLPLVRVNTTNGKPGVDQGVWEQRASTHMHAGTNRRGSTRTRRPASLAYPNSCPMMPLPVPASTSTADKKPSLRCGDESEWSTDICQPRSRAQHVLVRAHAGAGACCPCCRAVGAWTVGLGLGLCARRGAARHHLRHSSHGAQAIGGVHACVRACMRQCTCRCVAGPLPARSQPAAVSSRHEHRARELGLVGLVARRRDLAAAGHQAKPQQAHGRTHMAHRPFVSSMFCAYRISELPENR